MSVESALSYFRKISNKAVITGDDRSDSQLAALETPTKCIILTGELFPSAAILVRAQEVGGYVLGSYASMDVSGWRKNMQRTAAFYFTTLPDSYAARTGRPDDVGVIGVALFKRKPPEPVAVESWRPAPFAKDESPTSAPSPAAPSAERNESRDSAAKRAQAESPLGTGHGRQERNPARWVDFERATSYPVETIAIYYDSAPNLVAQGVIRAAPRPRDPNPFPGFAPDPVSHYRSWHRPPGA